MTTTTIDITDITDIIDCLLQDHGAHDDTVIPAIVRLAELASLKWQVTEEDAEAEALNDDEMLWVTSEHALILDGIEIATWTRCAVGSWGGNGGPGTAPDGWEVEEDTEGGDTVPPRLQALLDALEIEDEIPHIPAPTPADEAVAPAGDGEWAVWWETVGDDSCLVERYATIEDATAVAADKNRSLRARHPGGLLCGFAVRSLVDDEWTPCEDDA